LTAEAVTFKLLSPLLSSPASLSVVVPVYNAAGTLGVLAGRLLQVLDASARRFEIILVNDGSRDRSWAIIMELSASRPEIAGLDLMRNYGQHNALLCGIRAAKHDVIVTIDDDLQQAPEDILTLVAALEQTDADVVYGTPMTQQHGLWRNVASVVTKAALKSTLGAEVAPLVSTFRVFRVQLRDAFERYQSPLVSIDVLLSWATSRFAAIPVARAARPVGRSSYTFRSLVRHTLNMVTGFSVLPLQIATVVGFACTLFGLGILAFVTIRTLMQGSVVAGFPFLASVVTIFSGAQLFALGIIGEYLGRTYLRTMDRPPYAVRTRIQKEPAR
jgi:undecaprenyl-phosphate 4-deoxy-4-formamido-L-arabinose transferase